MQTANVIRSFLPDYGIGSGLGKPRNQGLLPLVTISALLFLSGYLVAISFPNAVWDKMNAALYKLFVVAQAVHSSPLNFHGLGFLAFILLKNLLVAMLVLSMGGSWLTLPWVIAVLGANGAGIGIVVDLLVRAKLPGLVILATFLPHGIIELPALFLAVALGWKLRRDHVGLSGRLRAGMRVVFPLFVLAALVEVYVTPVAIHYAMLLTK